MSIGLDWINDVAEWIGDLIPEWDLLEPTDAGVKFSWGGKVKILTPGRIYWFWPAISVVYTMNVKRQTISFTQRLTTKDEETVLIETVIVYIVDDVLKAMVETKDFDDTIEEVAQKLTVQSVMSRTFEQICHDLADSNEMRNELTRKARSLLSDYGVGVLDAYVSSFAETKVLSHEGDGLSIHAEEDE